MESEEVGLKSAGREKWDRPQKEVGQAVAAAAKQIRAA